MVIFTPRPLYPRRNRPGIHWTGTSVDPRDGLDAMKKRNIVSLPKNRTPHPLLGSGFNSGDYFYCLCAQRLLSSLAGDCLLTTVCDCQLAIFSRAVNCCWFRQHSHSWFWAPSGHMSKFLFVPRSLICFQRGTFFDERRGRCF
jgi:hypothetical protein